MELQLLYCAAAAICQIRGNVKKHQRKKKRQEAFKAPTDSRPDPAEGGRHLLKQFLNTGCTSLSEKCTFLIRRSEPRLF